MTIGDWLKNATEMLTASGCPDPGIDPKWICEDTLGLTRTQLHFEADTALTPEQTEELNRKLRRRAEGEPVQYILNSACFMGQNFYVDKRVLIPRQDTETLVEAAIVALHGLEEPEVLDLCTGSGAIGLSIKTLVPRALVTLTDISKDALEVAHRNAKELNAEVDIRHGDFFRAVGKRTFDMIVSNPPYIPKADLAMLQTEVGYEPRLALDGGEDGLEIYRRITAEAQEHLNAGGYIYLEVGIGEAEAVLELVCRCIRCAQSGVMNDLNGVPRVVWARSV